MAGISGNVDMNWAYRDFSSNTGETPTPPSQELKDDVTGNWAEASIEKAKKKRIMNGYEDGSFKPNQPVTRAQLAAILDRLGLLDK